MSTHYRRPTPLWVTHAEFEAALEDVAGDEGAYEYLEAIRQDDLAYGSAIHEWLEGFTDSLTEMGFPKEEVQDANFTIVELISDEEMYSGYSYRSTSQTENHNMWEAVADLHSERDLMTNGTAKQLKEDEAEQAERDFADQCAQDELPFPTSGDDTDE